MDKSQYHKVKKYYDAYGKRYDDERVEGYYEFINDIEIETVQQYGTGAHMLEIGCGTGILLARVAKFAKKAQGVDLSDGMLEEARKKGLQVTQANATKLPFPKESFDVVYSFKVLPHIPEIEKVIKEVYRVLNPGGTAILEFYNPTSFKALTNKLQGARNKVYLRFDSSRKIKQLLGGSFYVIETRGVKVLPFSGLLTRPRTGAKIVKAFEKRVSRSPLKAFAGYYIVVARKDY